MSHWKKAFPSKYLQAADLDAPVIVTIDAVPTENVGTGENAELKLVAQFKEDVKGCVLNMTRAEAIATIAGSDDTDRWVGVRIRLSRGMTRYQGKKVACIQVDPPTNRSPKLPTIATDDIDDAMPTLGDKEEAF